MKILQINSSARGQASHSTRLATKLVERLRDADPDASLTVRDLNNPMHPSLDEAALGALFTPAGERSPEQAARVALDDTLISRSGVTFRYTAQGPEGLLKGKKVYVALTRGGKYRNTPADTQVPYLQTIFTFLGLSNVHFVYAEGLAMGPDAEQSAITSAHAQIEEAVAA